MAEPVSSISTTSEHTERLLGFSDAVFAIAMTFLALDLGEVPESVGSTVSVSEFVSEHARDYGVYFATFLIVSLLWWRHHLVFRYIKRESGRILWLNIVVLALTALLPYPAAMVSEAPDLPLALVMLLVPLTLVAATTWAIFEAGLRSGQSIPGIPRPTIAYVRAQLAAPTIVLAAAAVLAAASWRLDNSFLRHASELLWVLLLVIPMVLRLRWPVPQSAVEVPAEQLGPEWESAAEAEAEQSEEVRSSLTRIRNGSDADRIKILTDGVAAIAVTILALQLTPPAPTDAQSNQDLIENFTAVPWWTYLTTFFLVCLFWRLHVRLFTRIIGVNTLMLWLNLLFLMFMSFLPTVAALMSQAGGAEANEMYLAAMFATSASLIAMSMYATYAKRLAIVSALPYQTHLRAIREAMLAASFLVALIAVLITQNPAWSGLIWVILIASARVNRVLGRSWSAKAEAATAGN